MGCLPESFSPARVTTPAGWRLRAFSRQSRRLGSPERAMAEARRTVRYTASRKALASVRGKHLQSDLTAMVRRLERVAAANREAAGAEARVLIGFTLDLGHTLRKATRRALADALIADSQKHDVPHQWERYEDSACSTVTARCYPKRDSTCYRDTSTNRCASA